MELAGLLDKNPGRTDPDDVPDPPAHPVTEPGEMWVLGIQRVGLDPTKFAGHSLRSGFATSAARGGADLACIMAQTGHKNADVARRYIQAGQLLQNPASKAVKL